MHKYKVTVKSFTKRKDSRFRDEETLLEIATDTVDLVEVFSATQYKGLTEAVGFDISDEESGNDK